MKNPFRFFFKKAADTGVVASPAPASEFQVAKFGTACISHAFLTVQDHVEWRAGFQGDDGRWTIKKMTEMPNISGAATPVGERVQKTTTLQSGLGFFDAIQSLAVYEQGQLALGLLPVDRDGPDHYQVFAQREGLIFDVDGLPHPTAQGAVVGDGAFTTHALDRARITQNYAPVKQLRDVIVQLGNVRTIIHCCFFNPDFTAAINLNVTRMSHDNFVKRDFCRDGMKDRDNLQTLVRLCNALPRGPDRISDVLKAILVECNNSISMLDIDDAARTKILDGLEPLSRYCELHVKCTGVVSPHYTAPAMRETYVGLEKAVRALDYHLRGQGVAPSQPVKNDKPKAGQEDYAMMKPAAIDAFIAALARLHDHMLNQQLKAETSPRSAPTGPRGLS